MIPHLDLHIGSKPAQQGGRPSSSLSSLQSSGKAPSPEDRIFIFTAFGWSDDEDNDLETVGRDHALLRGEECTWVVFSPWYCLQAALMGPKRSESM